MTQPVQPLDTLVPAALRRVAVIVIALCALTVAGLGVIVAHTTQGTSLDNSVANLLEPSFGPGGLHSGPGGFSPFFLGQIGQLGGPIPMTFLTCLLCYCCLAMRRVRGAVLLAISVIVASSLTEFALKPLVDRTYSGSLSFPSGHSTAAFALAGGVVVLLVNPPDTRMPRSLRAVLSVLAIAFGCLVALGQVAGHNHYFTDTVAGSAVGIGIALATALVIDRVAARRSEPVTDAVPASEPARLA